jgi:hypothetical protein
VPLPSISNVHLKTGKTLFSGFFYSFIFTPIQIDMIPENIQEKDILNAMKKIDLHGYPSSRQSEYYDLIYDNKTYPPKVVISYANISANGEELSSDRFNGGDETNEFLVSRGFPIRVRETRNPDGFFTREDLQFFHRYAGGEYDSEDGVDQNAGTFIRSDIWAKSRQWANLIAERLPFDIEGGAYWNEQSNGRTGQRFKDYTWYRLYHQDLRHPKVYYTVGVGSDKTLIIKLDCQRTGDEPLAADKVQYFDDYLGDHGLEWLIFDETQLKNLTWQQLTERSLEFIQRTLPVYRSMVSFVSANAAEKYARVCWNSKGWTQASGKLGKSQTPVSSAAAIQERDQGFGSEEWLLDIDKTIDGFHYGRLEPLHTRSGKHLGKTYHLTLFTLNGTENQWYWVARIENAEVITPEESQDIAVYYRTQGWLEEQLDQLTELAGVNAAFYERMPDNDRFNVRFRPEDLQIYDYTPFEEGEVPPTTHYNLADRAGEPVFFHQSQLVGLDLGQEDDPSPKPKITRKTTESYREFENIHGSIQKDLLQLLRTMYPNDRVYKEATKRADRSRIDVLRITAEGRHIFYEIKTYPSVIHSIRVAVGQLLEYAFYPEQELSSEYVIVTHLPAIPLELRYLAHLSRRLGCQFDYMHFDWKAKQIIPNPFSDSTLVSSSLNP